MRIEGGGDGTHPTLLKSPSGARGIAVAIYGTIYHDTRSKQPTQGERRFSAAEIGIGVKLLPRPSRCARGCYLLRTAVAFVPPDLVFARRGTA